MLAKRVRMAAGTRWYGGAIAAWQAKGAASQAASYLDITGNGYDLTAGSAPTWASGTGWSYGFGSGHYLHAGNNFNSVLAGVDSKFSLAVRIKTGSDILGNYTCFAKLSDSVLSENQRAVICRTNSSKFELGTYYALGVSQYRFGQMDTVLSTGTDYGIVVTYDGSIDTSDGLDRFEFYLAGVSQSKSISLSGGALGDIQSSAAYTGIGASVNSAGTVSTYNYYGDILAIGLWDSVLDSTRAENISAGMAAL